MNKRKKYFLIITGVLFTVLVITNPTNTDFDHYLRAKGFHNSIHGGRVNYFLFCSIYEVNFKYGLYREKERTVKCLGILGNFITMVDKE
jgi:hypothetical protein